MIERARTNLIYAATKYLDHIDAFLWPFELNRACYAWNEVPKEGSFSSSQMLSRKFLVTMYTDNKIPSRLGMPSLYTRL